MRAELKPLAHLKGLHGHFFLFLRREETSTVSTLPGHGVAMTGLVQVFLEGGDKENILNICIRAVVQTPVDYYKYF